MLSLVLALSAFVPAALPAAPVSGIGTAYCFGTNCPCNGNDDASAGCANSTGVGGYLEATGSTSVAADDIVYTASHLSTTSVSLLVFSLNQRNIPFHNGRLCVGPGMRRLRHHVNSGQDGISVFDDIHATLNATGFSINAGETWHGQVWYRDSAHQGVCGIAHATNLTNAYTVTFTP